MSKGYSKDIPYNQKQKQVYVILSVDTEHDIIGRYTTRTAGWSKGLPLLFDVFDATRGRGKVCWLIEFNNKEGILAANPRSMFFCEESPELIAQIKNRGDELGLHPSVADWLGGEREIPISSYNDPALRDETRRHLDPEFIIDLITSATEEFKKVCGVNPVGCRTGGLQYATHLATALEKNKIYVDSSVGKNRPWHWVRPPNAYYPTGDNIRDKANIKTSVVEIPTTGYMCNGWQHLLLKPRTWYLLHRRQPVFLSFFIHNWQAIKHDGSPDMNFLGSLSSFLRMLSRNGAQFLSWAEAKEVYDSMYEK